MQSEWTVVNWPHFLAGMVLVLIRLSGLMVFAPLFSYEAFPARIKIVFALVVTILLAPVVSGLPLAHAEIGVLPVIGELSIGMLFGLVLAMLSETLLFAGQIFGFQFSFSLVNLLDPNAPVQTPLFGQMLSLLGTVVLLAAGLHRTLLVALMRTFIVAPVGAFTMDAHSAIAIAGMASGIFLSALQLAAPVMASTLLVEVTVALVGRLSPQLPVMSITVPAKTMLGYVMLIGSLALWPRFIEMRFNNLLDVAAGMVKHAVVMR